MQDRYSILHGRSMCIHCHHELAWYDLMPVLSWLSLGGKCRYCHKPISWQYPVVELVTAALFVISYVFWPSGSISSINEVINFYAWLTLLVGFVALIVYDIKWMMLPNKLVYPMTILTAVLAVINIAMAADDNVSLLLSTVFSVLIAGGIFFLLFQASSGRWIGGGDVKLGLMIGLILQDPYKAFLMLMTASLLGTILILPGLATGKITTKSKIPFGPFLIIATIIVYLFGSLIIDWYKQSVLLLG